MTCGESVRYNDQAAVLIICECFDGTLDLCRLFNAGCDRLRCQRRGSNLDRTEEVSRKRRRVWVEDDCDLFNARSRFFEDFEPFAAHGGFERSEAGDVSSRP